jgi:M6 family metalloprotease-like protein
MNSFYSMSGSRRRSSSGRNAVRLAVVAVAMTLVAANAAAQSAYDQWIRSFQGISAREQAPTADPDHDGLANVAEQLLGLDPTIQLALDPNRQNAPALWHDRRGELLFRYRIDPKADASGEITHRIQQTTDFQRWQDLAPETDNEHYWAALGLDKPREFFRVKFSHHPPAEALPQPTFSARSEEKLGIFHPSANSPWQLSQAADGEWRGTYREAWANLRAGMWKKIAANFLVEGDAVPVAAMFSAEAYVKEPNKHLFVRLLVDGEAMQPADVLFATGGSPQTRAARSFEFTGIYNRGLHTLEVQWLGDENASGFIRDAALLIRQGDTQDERGRLLTATPDSAANLETTSSSWQDVPGLQKDVQTAGDRDCLTASVSAEAYANSGKSVWVRVLVDGAVAEPGPVRFASGAFEGTRTMAFGICEPAIGTHDVRVQWHADTGSKAALGDRTLTVSVSGNGNNEPMRQFFVAANNMVQAPAAFATVPGLSQFMIMPSDSDVSVIFTAEFPNPTNTAVRARLKIGNTPVPESEIVLTEGGTRAGVHSFTFDAKHIAAQSAPLAATVSVEWMSDATTPPAIAARSIVLYAKQHAVPDLAEPPALGLGYEDSRGNANAFRVEPMLGTRNVLVILFDPNRAGNPAPSTAALTTAFFGASDSIADYYDEVSEGRLKLQNAGVLGPYAADHPASYYWSGPGDHQDKWAEAVAKADADFDFSQYDFDGDGYISAWDELAVFIVVPQTNSAGYVRNLWNGAAPQKLDGVYLDLITEWYTSDPVGDYYLGVHEVGHQLMILGDLYRKSSGSTRAGTEPGVYCLMDQGGFQIAQHLNPAYKLALGWVTPRLVTQDAALSLEDVKVSREIVVLPRSPGTATDEYLVLENRPSPATNARYDLGLPDAGVAVWHIVPSTTDSVFPPSCTTQIAWDAQTLDDNARRGIRLIRPSVSYSDLSALWSNEHYDLDAFGLVCPSDGPARNVLLWADGTQSYEIRNFSAPAAVMTFNVINP